MSRSRLRVLILIGAFAVLSGGCTDGGAAGTLSTSAGGASTTSTWVEPVWVKGSLADLPLPELDGPPLFLGVVVHEFDGVTFLGPRGVVRTVERDIGAMDQPLWVDEDTVEFAGRLDSDRIQVFEVSADGTVDVKGPMKGRLPSMIAGDVLLYRRPGGKDLVGRPGHLNRMEREVWALAPNPEGWFLGNWNGSHPMKVSSSGEVEPYPLPKGWSVSAAAFGPSGMLAVSLHNGRLFVVSNDLVVEVDRLSVGASSLGWDQTGTVLVVVTGGEPPRWDRWLKCDLLSAGECKRITSIEFSYRDSSMAPEYWG